jgi:hypothetical protein
MVAPGRIVHGCSDARYRALVPDGGPNQHDDRDRRLRSFIVSIAVLLMCVGYASSVGPGDIAHFDHAAFEDTIRYQKAGEGYYQAFERAFADRGGTFSEIRGVRQPLTFLIWRLLPMDMLWPIYAVGVVGGVCWALQRVTRVELAVLPVAAYLLMSGRTPTERSAEQWLLVELWALLPLAISLWCWRSGKHWPAAAAATAAVLMRETTALYLLLATVLAWRSSDPALRRPWVVAALAAALGYAVHAYLALGLLTDEGSEAELIGSADAPRTMWEMAAWMIPGPDLIGVVVVVVAVVHLVRDRRDLLPLLGLFALVATGILVSRPYWGFLFVPFGILLFAERVVEIMQRSRRPVKPVPEPVCD